MFFCLEKSNVWYKSVLFVENFTFPMIIQLKNPFLSFALYYVSCDTNRGDNEQVGFGPI